MLNVERDREQHRLQAEMGDLERSEAYEWEDLLAGEVDGHRYQWEVWGLVEKGGGEG